MVIEIDPDGTLDPSLGVATRIPETGRMAVEVHEMPLFDLTVIPFLWSPHPDRGIVEAAEGMTADPEGHGLLWQARTLLPVGHLDVTAHQPVVSSSNNTYALMAETGAIRAMEGGLAPPISLDSRLAKTAGPERKGRDGPEAEGEQGDRRS